MSYVLFFDDQSAFNSFSILYQINFITDDVTNYLLTLAMASATRDERTKALNDFLVKAKDGREKKVSSETDSKVK